MNLKLYYTLTGNFIYSRIFDTEEDLQAFRTWVEDQGGDTRVA